MSERVERNSLVFKLAVFAFAAMFATIPLLYLLPLFGPVLPDNPTGMGIGRVVAMFALQFLLFVFFLRAARLLLCTAKGLALLCVIDMSIVVMVCVIKSARGDDPVLAIYPIPIIIASSYYLYCSVRKLI